MSVHSVKAAVMYHHLKSDDQLLNGQKQDFGCCFEMSRVSAISVQALQITISRGVYFFQVVSFVRNMITCSCEGWEVKHLQYGLDINFFFFYSFSSLYSKKVFKILCFHASGWAAGSSLSFLQKTKLTGTLQLFPTHPQGILRDL